MGSLGNARIGEAYSDGLALADGYEIQGMGDFDGDRYSDLLWRHTNGMLATWFRGRVEYGGASPTYNNEPGANPPTDWQVQAVGDFTGDGRGRLSIARTADRAPAGVPGSRRAAICALCSPRVRASP